MSTQQSVHLGLMMKWALSKTAFSNDQMGLVVWTQTGLWNKWIKVFHIWNNNLVGPYIFNFLFLWLYFHTGLLPVFNYRRFSIFRIVISMRIQNVILQILSLKAISVVRGDEGPLGKRPDSPGFQARNTNRRMFANHGANSWSSSRILK